MTNEIKTGAKLGTKVGEAVVYVVFKFGSFAYCGVDLYEGLTMEECVALRGNGDIESYCEKTGMEWHNVECSVDAVRGKLLNLRNEAEQTEATIPEADLDEAVAEEVQKEMDREEELRHLFDAAKEVIWDRYEHAKLEMEGIYDYHQAVLSDVIEYIWQEEPWKECNDRDELSDKLNDDLWTVDSVTGNGSGSYTFSRAKAEEFLRGNADLIQEMASEFGMDDGEIGRRFMASDWEWFDVSIRCYLLSWAIQYALDLLQDGLYKEVA